MQDPARTVVSQYATAPTLLSLLGSMNQWIDPTADFNAWFDLTWNVDTAQGAGLDVWGRIVGVGRVLSIPVPTLNFGFQDGAQPLDTAPFGQAPFFSGDTATSNYLLSDSAYRTLVLVKAAANIAASTAPAVNRLLGSLFAGRGRAYVVDGGDMSLTYVFEFALTAVEIAIIQQSGALPRPTGVSVAFQQAAANSTFSFS